MANSELSTLKSPNVLPLDALAPDTLSLDSLPPGGRARVAWIDPDELRQLAQHGLVEGALVRVESRAPFGGPLVVGIGKARLAIGRGVARAIRVEPVA